MPPLTSLFNHKPVGDTTGESGIERVFAPLDANFEECLLYNHYMFYVCFSLSWADLGVLGVIPELVGPNPGARPENEL
ncbi:hypothetical protein IAG41_08225 [Sphingomonas sp. JC676]|uniref:hypothetical protein n=1 Tax=Sphingomonas sp. JC676 TaxID=2768065 RepID=UPI001657E580|nr:hypothetical protein [Sphingomonas sp. JC676]MBC9032375.1 hypothetical protein [Sphingomonas sp. JC676]